jgi:uncharacterized membrane protein required for colicin V production
MIPIEIYWGTLIIVFAIVGMGRGLAKEIGTSAVLLLSLFALYEGQTLILDNFLENPPVDALASAPQGTMLAIYYGVSIIFVAFISYQGITLQFPISTQSGVVKWFFGYLGGLFNGYLIIGTIWDAFNVADYFGWKAPGLGVPISQTLSDLHNAIVDFLPISLLHANGIVPYAFLGAGMILLLIIILK